MRNNFVMPIGTKVGLTPVASITPVQIFCDDVTSLFISGTVTVNIGGADPVTYDALDFGSAQRIIQQINNAMNSGDGASAIISDTPTAPITFSSILWSTDGGANWNSGNAPALSSTIFQINGTGFSPVRSIFFRETDGSGEGVSVTPSSDILIVTPVIGPSAGTCGLELYNFVTPLATFPGVITFV
jgi:hypothetical protein